MSFQVVEQVLVDQLICHQQVRESFDEEDLTGMAQSIKENGVLCALLVRREGNDLVVLDGERRMRAAKRAGLATVPVVVIDQELGLGDVIKRQLVANCQRSDLSSIEKARAIDRLMKSTTWPASKVSLALGLSPASISKLLALLLLPPDVQQQVAKGKLAMSTAYELAKLPDPETRDRLTREAVAGGLARDHVAARARARGNGPVIRPRTRQNRDRVVIPMGEGRSLAVTGPGLSVDALVSWLEGLLTRIRGMSGRGVDLAELVKLVAPTNS